MRSLRRCSRAAERIRPTIMGHWMSPATNYQGSFAMKSRNCIVLCLFALVAVAGCASTKVTESQQLVTGQIARPNNIWVYDFVATPADDPPDSDVAAQSTQQTAEQIDMGRQLGAQIAQQLVADIQGMGLPAQEAATGTSPQ